MNDMTWEEELQKHMEMIEYYKEQLRLLELQFSYLQSAIADQTKAKLTLEKLSKVKKDADVLLPIGGGAFIDATAKNPSKVLFEVGGGVVLEKTADEAAEKIGKRITDLQQTEEKISSMAQQLQTGVAEASDKAERLLSNQQK
jgi:prefoldin alpha subunit